MYFYSIPPTVKLTNSVNIKQHISIKDVLLIVSLKLDSTNVIAHFHVIEAK